MGLHFRAIGQDGKESAYGERAGFGLITDEWNITNWIWQKVEVHENGVRAKYWPAHLNEPDEWHLDQPKFMTDGTRLGLRIGSGHVQIAHFAYGDDVVTPKRKDPWLYSAQDRYVMPRSIPLWYFPDNGDIEETYTVESELEVTPVKTTEYGVQLELGQTALKILKLSGRSNVDVQGGQCVLTITRTDPVQDRLTNVEKNIGVYKSYTRSDMKLHYDAAVALLELAKTNVENDDMDRARRRLADVEEARQTLKQLSLNDPKEEGDVIVAGPLTVHALGAKGFETYISLSMLGVTSMEILNADKVLAEWKNEHDPHSDVPRLHTFKVPPAIGQYTLRWRQGAEVHEQLIVAQVVETKNSKIYVNGEPFLVKGVNVHSLDSSNPQRIRKMMQSLKSLGFNTLRGDYPPIWEVEMAEEEDLLWTILAPFSVTSTEEIQYRQKGSLMGEAREIAIDHIKAYRDRPGVLLWNSCNEITGDTTAFLENLYPVSEQMDPISRRPVHYANLFGQDRWQGQDAIGINYYFGPGQTPTDRHPLIQRSVDIAKAHDKPVFYTEYNSYQGPIPATAVQAIEGLFEWGVAQGMSGGFFYMGPSSSDHPGVWLDADLNTDPAVAKAFRKAYADAEVNLTKGGTEITVKNKREFTLRDVQLVVLKDEQPIYSFKIGTVDPQKQISATGLKSIQELKGDSVQLQFVTHYGLKESIVLQ
jgi:hypothetical protein